MNNRRDFLKLAVSAGASMAVAGTTQLRADTQPPPGAVRAWQTTSSRKFQTLSSPPQWETWTGASPTGIHLEPGVFYQEVLGFGGAFTDASCYLFQKMDAQSREELLTDLLGPQGLRLSVGRTCIGSSDFSTEVFSYDESPAPDPELKRFSIDHDRRWVLPTLRQAREINPDLFLFSSPWSPPGWMKPNGSMLGGAMDNKYFDSYAQYFVKFLKAYADAGVKIQAVTVQNEVDTDQTRRMPAAVWGQEYEIGFVTKFLGPALDEARLDTKIWILDHNYNLWGRAVCELSDPDLNARVDGVAWHGYFGEPDAMSRVHDWFPAKHAYWTEGGPGKFHDPAYATDWAHWSRTFSTILRNWPRCIVSWNLLLNEKGEPNIGPFTGLGGLVTIDTDTKKLTRSGQYYAFAHYSKLIQRGAHICASWGDLHGIDHLAAKNPDGSHVLVVTNSDKGREQRVQCTLGSRGLNLVLPPDSITSLVW